MKCKYLEFSKKEGLRLKEKKIDNLSSHEVVVDVHYSGVNYKDALGVTGGAPIFKNDPIIPGIDLAGEALSGQYKGQLVFSNGLGLGESIDGGYTEKAVVPEEVLLPVPEGLTVQECMALGTAGFTAGLAVHRMIQNDQTPEKGPILVSGATGGVGSFAVQILKKEGFEVHVVTHRMQYVDQIKALGADKVHDYEGLFPKKTKPLDKARWGGVIDNLGGEFLSQALPEVALWGNVASIGLAKSAAYQSTVMPYILRGVSVLGVSSGNCTQPVRKKVWQKLGKAWKPGKILECVGETVTLDEVLEYSKELIGHRKTGRALVKIK